MESENGVLKALPMTTSRGAAAPHTLPAASGRERHVRDSPVVLGCARTLAAARQVPASLASCVQRLWRAATTRATSSAWSTISLTYPPPILWRADFYSFRSQALGAQLVLYVLEKA